MKTRWLSVLLSLMVISTLLVGNPVVSAQEIVKPEFLPIENYLPNYVPKTTNTLDSTKATTVVGEPGTSFRYVDTFGETGIPYFDDSEHLNFPVGLAIGNDDSIVILEEWGKRLLKYDSSGIFQFKIGYAGVGESGDYSFDYPQDGVFDAANNIWVAEANRVMKYTSTGDVLLQFPDIDPWRPGSENGRFNHVTGVAFDSIGRLFVSDSNNHRIQVFEMDENNYPVWIYSLGEATVSGIDNFHFNYPERITIQNDQLIVADSQNHRVQVFDVSNTDPNLFAYQTTIGVSGVSNDDNDHLDYPFGVAANNEYIAVSEGNNNRIQIFDRTNFSYVTTAVSFGSDPGLTWNPRDVAFDSLGNLYIADSYNHRVEFFTKQTDASWIYERMLGTTNVPYLTDNFHFNKPRVAIDKDKNIIIIEENGVRLSKFDPYGNFIFSVGEPGIERDPNRGNNDNEHFSWPHGVAVDSLGKIYVADNSRVQIYSPSGDYLATIGQDWAWGSGDYEFSWVTGLAVSPSGFIYVADGPNHRVQIYDSSYSYVGTIGESEVSGTDNYHFNYPIGVEVDSFGNIFVADINNCRVQKFASNLQYQLTFGVTGICDNQLGSVSADDVTVDSLGRVYVAGWLDRVDVFDALGMYLTTIGGSWGTHHSQFKGASGVAVDKDGFVYVSDFSNHRIQKFAPGYPNWEQININGFGDRRVEMIPSMAVFKEYLYAGTWFFDGEKENSQIWRSPDGKIWEMVGSDFGIGVSHMMEFKDKLYAGTWDGNLFYSENGESWIPIPDIGLETGIARFEVYNDSLFLSTWNEVTGTQIWKTENGILWTKMTVGFERPNNNGAISSEVFNNYLYYGVYNSVEGAELWRFNGIAWTKVFDHGLNDPDNIAISALEEFNENLYASVWTETGVEVFSSSNGLDWELSVESGLDNPTKIGEFALEVIGNDLFLVISNEDTGMEVWKTSDGKNWVQIAESGFGDSNNVWSYWDSATVNFNNKLVVGVTNWANGGEVWSYDTHKYIFLPLLMR